MVTGAGSAPARSTRTRFWASWSISSSVFPSAVAEGDARSTVGDPLVDPRRGVDVVVQGDGHEAADVVSGELPELHPALGVEGEVHLEVVGGLGAGVVRPGQALAGEGHRPLHQVGQVAVTGALGPVGSGGDALEEDLAVGGEVLLGVGQERLAVLSLQLLVAVGPHQLDARVGRRGVLGDQVPEEGALLVHHPELELGRGADELLGLLRVLLAGERDLDRVGAHLPHVDLGHAPLVDPAADDEHRLVHRILAEARHLGVPQLVGERVGGAAGAGEVVEALQLLLHLVQRGGVGRLEDQLQLLGVGGRR